MNRKELIFVSDIHLGLGINNPQERENRFVNFLKNIPRDRVKSVFLLGDIWDFWYEYRDVIPCYAPRVLAQIINLLDDGIEVYFCPGNHDLWAFSFFEKIGVKKITQPYYFEYEGKNFCVGHGDLLGGVDFGYTFMIKIFRSKWLQFLFSLLHPWIAYRIGLGWSNSNRRRHPPYIFEQSKEPLCRFANQVLKERKVDYFIFGHYHCSASCDLTNGAELHIIKDWISSSGSPYISFDGLNINVYK